MELKWEKLLSEKRIRNLYESPDRNRKSDHRTEFERDYDRAIFCTPVRRLHDKAQVFPLEPNDSIRTRLAHSLEVSTVARDIGKAISKWLLKEKKISNKKQAEAIPIIAATCGLLHDLGNPPFGHAGEDAIREWFKNKQSERTGRNKLFTRFKGGQTSQYAKDFLKFEGNAQTVRLVSRLQLLADYYGLNLTCGTLSALSKYTSDSIKAKKDSKYHEKRKVGYFASENDLMKKLRKETGLKDKRHPISFIIEACDDIAYSIVDIEDGVKKDVISWPFFYDKLKEKTNNSDDFNWIINKSEEIVKRAKGIGLTFKEEDITWVESFRVYAIGFCVEGVINTFKNKYSEIIAGTYHNELIKDSNACLFIESCKQIARNYVYNAHSNLRIELAGRKIIHDLMDLFWEGVSQNQNHRFAKNLYDLMSPNYKRVFEYSKSKLKLPNLYCQMQLVTDYICGMTDTFACDLHRKLRNG